MKTYLVGGAVRDALLELPVKERDWVVVGATPAELLARGYQAVGRDFPVFLHPETHEEYALARTGRNPGAGPRASRSHPQCDCARQRERPAHRSLRRTNGPGRARAAARFARV